MTGRWPVIFPPQDRLPYLSQESVRVIGTFEVPMICFNPMVIFAVAVLPLLEEVWETTLQLSL